MKQTLINQYPHAQQHLEAYADWLSGAGVERGLLGPREVDRIWDRHIANCAVVEEVIPQNSTVIDIGSGAGLPGLVIAIVRPDVHMTLVEPLLRRSQFLIEVVDDLQLQDRVTVVRGRAEENKGLSADIVTARAVAPLPKLLTWALPLTMPQGNVIAMKGSSAAQEILDAAGELNGRTAEIIQCGSGFLSQPTTVVRVSA